VTPLAARAVFDANALISGFVFHGVPGRCLDAAEQGKVECVVSLQIIEDVLEELATKFQHGDALLGDEAAWLALNTRLVQPPGQVQGICRDPGDDVVIDCALAASAEYIVTGDADLLSLGRYQSVEIITPAVFLAKLASETG
jgi:uncharacterized protein